MIYAPLMVMEVYIVTFMNYSRDNIYSNCRRNSGCTPSKFFSGRWCKPRLFSFFFNNSRDTNHCCTDRKRTAKMNIKKKITRWLLLWTISEQPNFINYISFWIILFYIYIIFFCFFRNVTDDLEKHFLLIHLFPQIVIHWAPSKRMFYNAHMYKIFFFYFFKWNFKPLSDVVTFLFFFSYIYI